ncbi:hypothetical protein BC2903_60750 [Bacillus cereus]|nr:hypothetical protein BC2903_60750 [Bacillus cereus]
MALRKEIENKFYVPVVSMGEVAFQEKNLGLEVAEINQQTFLETVFGEAFKGHLCVFQKTSDGRTKNVFYKENEMERMRAFLHKTFGIDTYFSYSTFYRKHKQNKEEKLRTQSNIVETYLLVQDLDFYKLGMSDAEFLSRLGTMILSGELIPPNFLVSTGRGYQLIWLVEPFKNIEGFANDRDWRKIQEHLFNLLKGFNSDSVVKTPSAVTRLIGTKHRTSGNLVHGYYLNQQRFTLKDFIFYYNLLPESDRTVKPRKNVKQTQVTRMVGQWNTFTLNRQREEDIFTFVQVQNERKRSYVGIRNWLSLVLRFHSLVSTDGDIEYATKRVLDLCNIMDMTETSEEEILRRSKTAEGFYNEWINDTWNKEKYFRGGLFYTNSRMLELMDIKEDYYIQWKMKTIKVKTNKYESERKRFERLEKGQTKGTMEEYQERRKEAKNDKTERLKEVLEENPKATIRELAEKTGMSKTTVGRILKELRK